MHLEILKELLDSQITHHDKMVLDFPSLHSLDPFIDILKDIRDRAQASIDAGPSGEVAPIPELKDAYIIDAWQDCLDETTPRITTIRLPYSVGRFNVEVVTISGKGEGIWYMTYEVFDSDGRLVDRDDIGELELPFPGFPEWHGHLCHRMEMTFEKPETQTIVLYLAGQEVRRLQLTYEDLRV
jgi:hypothetical protein